MTLLGTQHCVKEELRHRSVSVIGEVAHSQVGNTIMRVGKNEGITSWFQTEYIVLTPLEAIKLLEQIEEDANIKILRALIQHCREHDNTEDDYGITCDERGCGICNADSDEEAATMWFEQWQEGMTNLPFDPEDLD